MAWSTFFEAVSLAIDDSEFVDRSAGSVHIESGATASGLATTPQFSRVYGTRNWAAEFLTTIAMAMAARMVGSTTAPGPPP